MAKSIKGAIHLVTRHGANTFCGLRFTDYSHRTSMWQDTTCKRCLASYTKMKTDLNKLRGKVWSR